MGYTTYLSYDIRTHQNDTMAQPHTNNFPDDGCWYCVSGCHICKPAREPKEAKENGGATTDQMRAAQHKADYFRLIARALEQARNHSNHVVDNETAAFWVENSSKITCVICKATPDTINSAKRGLCLCPIARNTSFDQPIPNFWFHHPTAENFVLCPVCPTNPIFIKFGPSTAGTCCFNIDSHLSDKTRRWREYGYEEMLEKAKLLVEDYNNNPSNKLFSTVSDSAGRE